MRKIILFVMVLVSVAFAETGTWNGTSSDMNLYTNYTGLTGAIDSADSIAYTDNSVVAATATAALSVLGINVDSTYSGAWSLATYGLTVASDAIFNGTGALNLGAGITMNGASSTLHIDSTVGTVTSTSCILTVNGTTGCNYTSTKSVTFPNLTLGAAADLTATENITIQGTGTILTLGDSSQFTYNKTVRLRPKSSGSVYTLGSGASFDGDGTTGNALIFYLDAASSTFSLPAISLSGAHTISFTDAGWNNSTFQLTGNFSSLKSGSSVRIYSNVGGINDAFNMNGHNFSCNILYVGSLTTSTQTINFSSGTHTIGGLANYGSGDNLYLNHQTSTINCSGNWLTNSNYNVNPGTTSKLNFVGASASVLTTALKYMPSITVAKNVGVAFSTASATVDTFANFTANSGVATLTNKTVVTGSVTSNCTADGDTLLVPRPIEFGVDYTIASGANETVDSAKIATGALASDITSSGENMAHLTMRKADDAVMQFLDDCGLINLVLDSGTATQNGMILTIRSDLTISADAIFAPDTNVVFAEVAGGTSAGTVTCGGKTLYSATLNKGTEGITLADPMRIEKELILTDGEFDASSVDDTIYILAGATMTVSSADTVALPTVSLGIGSSLVLDAGTKIGFASGAVIVVAECDAPITNTAGITLPTIIYPDECGGSGGTSPGGRFERAKGPGELIIGTF